MTNYHNITKVTDKQMNRQTDRHFYKKRQTIRKFTQFTIANDSNGNNK